MSVNEDVECHNPETAQSSEPELERAQRKEIPSILQKLSTWCSQEIDIKLAYLPLLVCCFVTGLVDSAVYITYGTFVSMQTGNTIFIATGASDQNTRSYGWARSLCSVGFFVLGSFSFSRLATSKLVLGHNGVSGHPQRGSLCLSFALQTCLVVISAAVIQAGLLDSSSSVLPSLPGKNDVIDWVQLAPIALLSFQAAGQIVASRTLGVGEVPTVVITSLLCDLLSDPKLTSSPRANPKRNKRLVAFVLTLVGGIVGGWACKGTGGVQTALWLVAGIKFVITLSWFSCGSV